MSTELPIKPFPKKDMEKDVENAVKKYSLLQTSQKELKSISLIQSKFLKKRFLSSLQSLKKVFADCDALRRPLINDFQLILTPNGEEKYVPILLNDINTKNERNNKRFDLLDKQIKKLIVLKMVNIFLKRLYRFIERNNSNYNINIAPKLNAKTFLSSYVITGYPEIVLSMTKIQLTDPKNIIGSEVYNYDVYHNSNLMLDNLHNILMHYNSDKLRQFIKSINIYSNTFTLFLNVDRINKLTELANHWHETEKTKCETLKSRRYSDDQKSDTLEVINNGQEKTIKLIQKLDPNFDIKNLQLTKTFIDTLEENMHKAYWDVLKDDIKNNNYEILMKSLQEIRTELLSLRSNDKKFREDFDEHFDLELIKQMIDNKVMSMESFLNYAEFIVAKIIYLQSPAHNVFTREEWSELKQNLIYSSKTSEDGSTDLSFETTVPKIIEFIQKGIRNIKDTILNLALLTDLGINVLNIK
jgi:hypothetical protein